MKIKHYTLSVLLATFISAMPLTHIMASELSAPQVSIAEASDKLQQRMQDKGFIKDFNKVTQFVGNFIERIVLIHV